MTVSSIHVAKMEEVLERCRAGFADLSGQDMLFSRDFEASEFKARRQQLADTIGPEAHLLVPSAPPVSGDSDVQDALFYYLCGLETVHSYILVDGKDGRTTIFLPTRDMMDGEPEDKLGFEDAAVVRERLDVDEVKSSDELTAALGAVKTIYLPHCEVEGGGATRFSSNSTAARRHAEAWDAAEPRHKSIARMLEERFPGIRIEDAAPLISQMRTIKSPAEIEVLRQAGHLSAMVMIESMKATKTGMNEASLQAIAQYIYFAYGHCGLGYGVIGASGANIWNGHYHRNNATLKDGDVVLMDCGPDLRHYTSDIARVWPVSGTYSDWHRKVYGTIVEYHKTLLSLIKPGVLVADIYAEADKIMLSSSKTSSFPYQGMTGMIEAMIEKGVGYLNHGVGLSVHDAMGSWRDEPLKEGFVVVVDPMVWCKPEHQYIRVEDTIVVTSDGCERLTGAAPIEPDEIEAMMKEPSRFDVV